MILFILLFRFYVQALDVKSRGLGLGNFRGVGLKSLGHFDAGELLDLLRSTTNEGAGVKKAIQFGEDRTEELGAADTVEEVVVLTVLLNIVGGLVREDA